MAYIADLSRAKDSSKNKSPDSPSPEGKKEPRNKSQPKKPADNKVASKPFDNSNKDNSAKDNSAKAKPTAKGSSLTSLNDLPSLGGKKQALPVEEESNGFGDFDFGEDHIGDSGNKLSDAEKRLQDFYKEESEGFNFQGPTAKAEKKPDKSKAKAQPDKSGKGRPQRRGFKVKIDGVEDRDEDEIEEEIQTDRDEFNHVTKVAENSHSGNYGTGITVSQSLGVDPSVDSLAIDEYDHIEVIMN